MAEVFGRALKLGRPVRLVKKMLSETKTKLDNTLPKQHKSSVMEKVAFVMTLLPGNEAEYKKRHDEIWPELVIALKDAGVSDYSIFHEESSNKLFAVLKRTDDHKMEQLPLQPIVQKWWAFMADIMETHDDNSPVSMPINNVFHME